jgi:hypothetical protein
MDGEILLPGFEGGMWDGVGVTCTTVYCMVYGCIIGVAWSLR